MQILTSYAVAIDGRVVAFERGLANAEMLARTVSAGHPARSVTVRVGGQVVSAWRKGRKLKPQGRAA